MANHTDTTTISRLATLGTGTGTGTGNGVGIPCKPVEMQVIDRLHTRDVLRVPLQVPAPVPLQVPAPVPLQVPAPLPLQVPAPLSAPVSLQVLAPLSAPVSLQVLAPVPLQVPAPVPLQVPAPVSAPVTSNAFMQAKQPSAPPPPPQRRWSMEGAQVQHANYLLRSYTAAVRQLQDHIHTATVKQKRLVFRVMCAHEHHPNRCDLFVPDVRATTGEFCFYQVAPLD